MRPKFPSVKEIFKDMTTRLAQQKTHACGGFDDPTCPGGSFMSDLRLSE